MRTRRRWWQSAASPRAAFAMAAGYAVIGSLAVFVEPWWLATAWLVLAALWLASACAMLRWGSPEPRTKYPTRWFPFWPPDER